MSGLADRPSDLNRVSDALPGLARRRVGQAFVYIDPRGRRVRAAAVLRRVKSLAIPPAWSDVWICPDAKGHLQATGRDARGRKQYRYHPRFREQRESEKYAHLLEFAKALPRIRAAVAEDMAAPGLSRDKVIATVVYLLEATLIRVGNADYARQNKSYGLTTMRDPHVAVDGAEMTFDFTGKSGRAWRIRLKDRRIARIVKACRDLPGQHLFQYLDDDGKRQRVSSGDVNAYLRRVSGRDVTAKDFRTWAGTLMAALTLAEQPAAESAAAKRIVKAAVAEVAERLGNTVAVCRKGYIHPVVIEAYEQCTLARRFRPRGAKRKDGLECEEAALIALLKSCR
ncbi:MAG: DNA topoisomerase IB [Rhodospirillaceae bacterium]